MFSEHAFLRQRLALVERCLAEDPDREFIYDDKGRARYRTNPSTSRVVSLSNGSGRSPSSKRDVTCE